jgi:hypothetical protein
VRIEAQLAQRGECSGIRLFAFTIEKVNPPGGNLCRRNAERSWTINAVPTLA